ncbi:MAG: hypothetical protein GF401_06215 [Chitinivibrionales bacterium]|nr:hypothetical protein [Chitinivibrionales bacterium]
MKRYSGKKSFTHLKWLFFALFTLNSCLFGLSGIAVSDFTGEFHGIDVHFIENNEWQDSLFLIAGPDRLQSRFPQINSHGTHCAFLHKESDGWYVCVTRIGGVNKTIKKLTKLPDNGDVGDGKIWSPILEWPRGEWIWYTTEKFNQHIWRVNVHTGDAQHIVDMSETSNQMQLCADTKLMMGSYGDNVTMFRMPDADSLVAAGGNPVTLSSDLSKKWNEGGNLVSTGGCGIGISPSRMFYLANNNGWHTRVGINRIDTITFETLEYPGAGDDGNVDWTLWDSWAVDTSLKNPIYDEDNHVYRDVYQSTGTGNSTLGGWSANSDYWTCTFTGWAPQGRDMENGSNLLTFNWIREESMNLTRHPCEYDTINNPDGDVAVVWHGDFFVTDPVEDIASGYIDDYNNAASFHIEGTDTEIIDRVAVHLPRPRRTARPGFGISPDIGGGRISIPLEGKGIKTVKVFDCSGKLIFKHSTSESYITIPESVFSSGINVIRIVSVKESRSGKVIRM